MAYKEGWEFKPENLQVVYIPPGDSRFPQDGCQYRIFEFNDEAANKPAPVGGLPYRISSGSRLGFKQLDEISDVVGMRPEEADDLGERVEKLFK